MADKRKATPTRGIIVYLVLVVITGLMLAATGNFDNPFTAIAASLSAEEHGEVSKGTAPRSETGDRNAAAGQTTSKADETKNGSPTQGDPTLTHEEAENINWSRIGDVLFDIWFIAMVSAVIIVVQHLFSAVLQGLKKRSRPALTR